MNLMTALEAIHGSLQIFFFLEEIWKFEIQMSTFTKVQGFTVKNTEFIFFIKTKL